MRLTLSGFALIVGVSPVLAQTCSDAALDTQIASLLPSGQPNILTAQNLRSVLSSIVTCAILSGNNTLSLASATITNLTAAVENASTLTATNLQGTNVTIANSTVSSAAITNLTATSATITNLVATTATAANFTAINGVLITPVAIASLTTCTSTVAGMKAVINNGASTTYLSTVSSTGSLTIGVQCYYNGASYFWAYD